MTVVDKLATTAAEKRAYRWMYHGGPGMGMGYGGVNPYMGGMGYGGGGYGGMPMSYDRSPYGSHMGIDPRFAGFYGQGMQQGLRHQNLGFMQGLGQQSQMFQRQLPGVDIGLQGQQAEVESQRQMAPELQHQRGLNDMSAGHAFGEQNMGEGQLSALEKQLEAARGEYSTRSKGLGELAGQMTTAGDPFAAERAQHEQAIAALSSASGTGGDKNWAILKAQEGDPQAIALLKHLGYNEAPRLSTWQAAAARIAPGTSKYDAALNAMRQLNTLDQRRSEKLAPLSSQEARLKQEREQYGGQVKTLEEQIRQHRLGIQNVQQRAGEEGYQRRNQVFGQAQGTSQNVAGIATQNAANPAPPGTRPTHGPQQAPQGQTPLPASTQPPPTPAQPLQQPPSTFAPPQTVHPPGGAPGGARGPSQGDDNDVPRFGGDESPFAMMRKIQSKARADGPTGGFKMASLVELADMSARVRVEKDTQRIKQAGLADKLFGGQGMSVPGAEMAKRKAFTPTSGLMENLRGAGSAGGLPQVAKAVKPTPSIAELVQAHGMPQGLPHQTLAHMPVESAIGMGLSAEHHAILRKALGLG